MTENNRNQQQDNQSPTPVTLDDVYGGFRKVADQAAHRIVQEAIDSLGDTGPR